MSEYEPFPPITGEEFDALAASPIVEEARFRCARHGTEAGMVRLRGGYTRGWMVEVESFVYRRFQRVHEPRAEALREHIARGDVQEIYVMDVAWAPFYCVYCNAVYCGACWRTEEIMDPDLPGWVDSVRGVCPAGHERMLSD
ncbi:hypothetical protein [Longimicrobium sp.]|uniref:hypothetical protein n=1 Tax=Longimicrobium sp. TaxID=2029185 RepID=UPI002E339F77|nr:hypothetical protein [Longimicrobium sp.]HEX6041588.1 hypothetical protein [Longimicrobium sp.]